MMSTFPLSSSLPPCNSIVVLDECSPVKGDGLGFPGRLLVDGCGGRGVEGVVHRPISHQSMRQRVQLSELKVMEGEQRGQGGGRSVVLIKVKGTVGHTRKVNGKNSDRVRETDRAGANICLA